MKNDILLEEVRIMNTQVVKVCYTGCSEERVFEMSPLRREQQSRWIVTHLHLAYERKRANLLKRATIQMRVPENALSRFTRITWLLYVRIGLKVYICSLLGRTREFISFAEN